MASTNETATCIHCGTPFHPKGGDEQFCCNGCRHVHALIHDGGLDQFYDLQRDNVLRPVENLAFEQRDYSWMGPLVSKAEAAADDRPATLELGLGGVSCAACVWLIAKVFEREPGAVSADADPTSGRVLLRWQTGECDLPAFAKTLQSFGYELTPAGESSANAGSALGPRVGLCAAFAMNAMAFTLPRYLGMPADFALAGLFELIAAASAALAMIVGGSYFVGRALRSLRRGVVHIDLPIALGVIAAFGGSMLGWVAGYTPLLYFDFVAVFLFLMLGGRYLQERALARSRNKLAEHNAVPERFQPADGSPDQPLASLAKGTRYSIKPGAIVPVASEVFLEAPFGLGWISGEAEAPPVPAGGVAPSGSVYLGRGEATLAAREHWDDSLLKRLTAKPVGQPDVSHDPRMGRFITVYILAVVVIGVVGAIWWWLASGDAARALQVAVSLFVVSCPCALGVALPLAERLAASRAARHGAYPRHAGFWSRLARVRKAIFDKTGTLTVGRPVLVDDEPVARLDRDAAAALAALVGDSAHPISRALAEALAARHVTPGEGFTGIEETPGRGVSSQSEDGTRWELWRDEEERADAVLRRDGEVVSRFQFQDRLRPAAREELATLDQVGIETFLMSGDRKEKVAAAAKALGIPPHRWRARMSPDQKAEWVTELDHRDTLYLGDGANDSLAFDRAFCTATPASELGLLSDKADLYFLGRSLGWLGAVLPIARARRRAVRRVFAFALAYNAAAATLALAGLMNPLLAAVLMPFSSATTVGIVTTSLKAKRVAARTNTSSPTIEVVGAEVA